MVPPSLIFFISSKCPSCHCKSCTAQKGSFTVGCGVNQPGELDCPPPNHSSQDQSEYELICSSCQCPAVDIVVSCILSFSKICLPCLKLVCPPIYVSMKSTSVILGDLYLLTSSFKKFTDLLVERTYHQGTPYVCM